MSPSFLNHLIRSSVVTILLALSVSAFAENGVSKDKILFGQAAALEGPAAALGKGMQLGIRAAFKEANSTGGINGRKLELKVMMTATSQTLPYRP
jgi:branched-chain amino acid transport system substrate-binding protein